MRPAERARAAAAGLRSRLHLESSLSPRSGARRSVVHVIRDLPRYVRLLGGLLLDRRVRALDKALVGLALAYIALPADLIPDFVPFLGQVDDVYFLVLAVQRLVAHAGPRVVAAHWDGRPGELSPKRLRAVLSAAAFFLPRRTRWRLRRLARR